MLAEQLLKDGDLDGALSALQDAIRADAANPKLRIFLFQLLCVLGDWKRAIAQLKICGEMDPEAVPMAQTYREAIICENYREKVFAGEKEPLIFGEPEEWIALTIQALKAETSGQHDQAGELRAKALDAAPAVSGEVNGEAFAWIADADTRLGPLLEVIINGRYFWMPFHTIATAMFEAPSDLRDAVWTPFSLTLTNGGDIVALIPTRYAGTVEAGTNAEKLARSTVWTETTGGAYHGVGQRLFATDANDIALMDFRLLKMDVEPVADDG